MTVGKDYCIIAIFLCQEDNPDTWLRSCPSSSLTADKKEPAQRLRKELLYLLH